MGVRREHGRRGEKDMDNEREREESEGGRKSEGGRNKKVLFDSPKIGWTVGGSWIGRVDRRGACDLV